jgi:hypothetical protein
MNVINLNFSCNLVSIFLHNMSQNRENHRCSHARMIIIYALLAERFVSSILVFYATDRLFHFCDTCLLAIKNAIQDFTCQKRNLVL